MKKRISDRKNGFSRFSANWAAESIGQQNMMPERFSRSGTHEETNFGPPNLFSRAFRQTLPREIRRTVEYDARTLFEVRNKNRLRAAKFVFSRFSANSALGISRTTEYDAGTLFEVRNAQIANQNCFRAFRQTLPREPKVPPKVMPDSVAQLAPGTARYRFGIAHRPQQRFHLSTIQHMKYTLTLTAQLKHCSF